MHPCRYVRAWQEAADALGVPVCTTVAVVNASNALLVEQTTVHSPINATAGGSPLPEPAPAPSSQPAPAGDNATVAEVRTGWNVGHLGPVECTYYEPKPAPAFVNIPDKQGCEWWSMWVAVMMSWAESEGWNGREDGSRDLLLSSVVPIPC